MHLAQSSRVSFHLYPSIHLAFVGAQPLHFRIHAAHLKMPRHDGASASRRLLILRRSKSFESSIREVLHRRHRC
jgi:hypothetical protein